MPAPRLDVMEPPARGGDRPWRLGAEVRQLLSLAGPVVLAEIGWMAMGLVDTVMVGPLGPAAIGAVGLGGSVFMAVAIFGMGILLGLDTLVSQAHGAGRAEDCRRWLVHGVALALVIALPMTLAILAGTRQAGALGLHADVERLALPYLRVVTWSLLPLLLYAACRRYLQGMSLVRPITFALVSANLVNAAANYTLIYGAFGAPALGVTGAAWATVVSRVYMVAVLALAVWLHDRQSAVTLRSAWDGLHLSRLRRLVALGLPASVQITLEVGVFAAATVLAGGLDPVALASHQIALNIAAAVFMVPLGVASATAVLVGQAVGRRDQVGAARAGWTALGTIAIFMVGSAVVMITAPGPLLRPFTSDAFVLALGARLLVVASIFQLFDGLQVVATGALRGIGDTRTPMLWNLVGHWGLGLPVAYVGAFRLGWGVVGLWIGLALGLTVCGIVLLRVWQVRVRRMVGVSS
jgi:MATE family multidrug resistance protein